MKNWFTSGSLILLLVASIFLITGCPLFTNKLPPSLGEIIFVEGGTFMMGDTWGDGRVGKMNYQFTKSH